MPEHVHGCLTCRPDMVPDFDHADPRYHGVEKCRQPDGIGIVHVVKLDGVVLPYTSGHFVGREGWALFAGETKESIHACPCGTPSACVTPRFGVVTSEHL